MRAILFNKLVAVSSIEISPNYYVINTEFNGLIDQLSEPYLVIRGFNVHNNLWGDSRYDTRGWLIENFLVTSGVHLFYKKNGTYYDLAHTSYSSIDLVLGSPTPFLN